MYCSAAVTAHRLGFSKTHLLACVRDDLIRPKPVKVNGKPNSPWLFSPDAKIVTKTLDKRKVKAR